MKTLTTTEHVLEINDRMEGPAPAWRAVSFGMYREPSALAARGRTAEALATAAEACNAHYGKPENVRFRVVTVTRTISVESGSIEE